MHGEFRHRTYRTRQRMRDGSYGQYDWIHGLPAYKPKSPRARFHRRAPSQPNQLRQVECSMVISDETIQKIREQGEEADPDK